MPKKKFIFEKIPENAIKLYLTSKKKKKSIKAIKEIYRTKNEQ